MGRIRPLVAVSGGFDPIHKGHVQMILEASKFGDVVVILNSDDWLERKKGYKFMDFAQRSFIAGSIKGVVFTTGVDDSDGTVRSFIQIEANILCKRWRPQN